MLDGLVIIARFDTQPEAWLARGKLEAEGLETWLEDEHLVQADWLYSIAVGGIKLLVEQASAERALTILQRDDSAMLENLDE